MILCVAVLLALAAAVNGAMDRMQFRYGESVFAKAPASWQGWLNPQVSWHNKWKNGDRTQGEAFPLSSTALVGLTDGWHFLKSLMISLLILAALAPLSQMVRLAWWGWGLAFFGLYLIWGAAFELVFRCL